MSIKKIASKNIRRFRTEADMSRVTLAVESGLHVTYIARIENNPANLTLENLEKIANALKRHPGELIGFTAVVTVKTPGAVKKLEQAEQLIRDVRASIVEPE